MKNVLEIAMEIALPFDFLEQIKKTFGPDKARDCAMSTSVGGIGPLLRERIFEQGDAGIDVVGVTLLYESVWVQTWHEWGQINLQKRMLGQELRQLMKQTDLGFQLTFFDGTKVDVDVMELNYGKAKVYFLSAPSITNIVYPGPKDMTEESGNPFALSHEWRLKQSWLVGRGALILSKKLNRKPDITVLSETPTLFVHHRLIKDEFQSDPFFNDTKYIFNDHTPLEYAHPIWDSGTLDQIKLDPSTYTNTPAWNGNKKTLDVTSLLVSACEAVYGVARKHGDVMKAMPSLKIFADKIRYVTNGVRLQDWQAPELRDYAQMSDAAILEARQKRKLALLDWVWRHCHLWPTWAKQAANRRVVVWTRRITPYKRLDILVKMLQNNDWRQRFLKLNLVVLVGGRIHQQDTHAQDIVYALLDILDKNEELGQRIVPIDNFNVWEAPLLYQGCDAAMMIADDTREASATGFMKGQMNGASIIATDDGAVPEFVRYANAPGGAAKDPNGFFVPYVNGEPTSLGLLEALEEFDRVYSDPARVIAFTRSALSVTEQVGVKRTVQQVISLYNEIQPVPA